MLKQIPLFLLSVQLNEPSGIHSLELSGPSRQEALLGFKLCGSAEPNPKTFKGQCCNGKMSYVFVDVGSSFKVGFWKTTSFLGGLEGLCHCC